MIDMGIGGIGLQKFVNQIQENWVRVQKKKTVISAQKK